MQREYKNTDSVTDIIVVGGGIIGVCCALALQKAGRHVTLIERDAISGGASGGNAGHIASEQVYPVASPDVIKDIPKMLFNPLGPLHIDPCYLPQLMPWMVKLLLNLRPQPFTHSSKALQQANQLSLTAWEALLASENLSHLMRVNGSYLVAEKHQSAKTLQEKISVLEKVGVPVQWVNQASLHAQLPILNKQQLGGLFFPETAHVVCPTLLCHSLHQQFESRGGTTRFVTVNNIKEHHDVVSIGVSGHEEQIRASQVVVATGIFSTDLVESISGIKPPLQAERGYHLMTQLPQTDLIAPVTSIDRRFIMTPMQDGLRLAGTVEYASLHAKPNYRRATQLLELANGMLAEPLERTNAQPWMGLRPTLPDSLPVIDRVGRIGYAFGHQHLGLTQAAITAEWMTQLMTEQPVTADLSAYRLNRFDSC